MPHDPDPSTSEYPRAATAWTTTATTGRCCLAARRCSGRAARASRCGSLSPLRVLPARTRRSKPVRAARRHAHAVSRPAPLHAARLRQPGGRVPGASRPRQRSGCTASVADQRGVARSPSRARARSSGAAATRSSRTAWTWTMHITATGRRTWSAELDRRRSRDLRASGVRRSAAGSPWPSRESLVHARPACRERHRILLRLGQRRHAVPLPDVGRYAGRDAVVRGPRRSTVDRRVLSFGAGLQAAGAGPVWVPEARERVPGRTHPLADAAPVGDRPAAPDCRPRGNA